MRKLIIGCGYLGRRVAAAWAADGHHVSALTRSSQRGTELQQLGIEPIIGDLCDVDSLPTFPDVETVLFAVGHDKASTRSKEEVQIGGLSNILSKLSKTSRLIYISSSSVYGQSAGEWVDETSECQPVQPGGECCLAAEKQLLASISNQSMVNCANVLRLSGIYGPDRLLSRIETLRAGQSLTGTGNEWLNLIHVDDAVQAVLACERFGQPGATYLVTDDRPILRSEYYGLLASLVDAPAPRFDPTSATLRGSGGLNKRCSNRLMHEQLHVTLRYPSINEGLPQALAASAVPPSGLPHHPAG